MRLPIIIANWKMNNTVQESLKFLAAFVSEFKVSSHVDVAIAPPFTALYSLGVAAAETNIKLAAQNIFWEDSGAWTGEIAGGFLTDVGCGFVIIGHSERRQYFGETDSTVNLRVRAAIRHKLVPIMCVGENLAERESGRMWDVVEKQLRGGLKDVDLAGQGDFVIAYEPIWAIGTGRTATPGQAEEVHLKIRRFLGATFNSAVADRVRIIYGGSVKPSNSRELMSMENIDGALVGGASLNPHHFAAIAQLAHS